MIFLFEKYSYDSLNDYLPKQNDGHYEGLPDGIVQRNSSLDGVGYFLKGKETVFVLPKVFCNEDNTAFGIPIEDIAKSKDGVVKGHKRFFSELAFWVCSSISSYYKSNPKRKDVSVSSPIGRDYTTNEVEPTLMEVSISMRQFYRDNKKLFAFTSKNKNCGNNKTNWQKTISQKQPFIQDGIPIYMELVNKKKVFDLDDRLLVLYFSAMNYIQTISEWEMPKSEFYTPIPVNEFRRLLGHKGLMELKKIKHKYFSDKFRKLYNIMQAFFEWGAAFKANKFSKEYMLVGKYNNVFEHMIDSLLGDTIPKEMKYLKTQRDGKEIDHLYLDQSLIFGGENEKMWFVGDSKYYSDGNKLSRGDLSKQFTYAKNIIQYNIHDSFNPVFKGLRYRDVLTEGYGVTPNFFIRGFLPDIEAGATPEINMADKYFRARDVENIPFDKLNDTELKNRLFALDKSAGYKIIDDDGTVIKELEANDALWKLRNFHYRNRLFDRDTLLLQVFNVNFLYTLRAFLQKNSGLGRKYREDARAMFRDNFLRLLDEKYSFWKIEPEYHKNPKNSSEKEPDDVLQWFVLKHFKKLQGKLFRRNNKDSFLILALEKDESDFSQDDEKSAEIWKSIANDCYSQSISVKRVLDDQPLGNTVLYFAGEESPWGESYGVLLSEKYYKMIEHDIDRLPKYAAIVKDGAVNKVFLLNGCVLTHVENKMILPFTGPRVKKNDWPKNIENGVPSRLKKGMVVCKDI